jgi:hypothetical protein
MSSLYVGGGNLSAYRLVSLRHQVIHMCRKLGEDYADRK